MTASNAAAEYELLSDRTYTESQRVKCYACGHKHLEGEISCDANVSLGVATSGTERATEIVRVIVREPGTKPSETVLRRVALCADSIGWFRLACVGV